MAHRNSLPILLAIASLSAALAGCGDDPTQPGALFDLAEAEAVVRSAEALPSLPEIVAIAATGADPAQRAVLVWSQELWLAGAVTHDASAASLRHHAVTGAAPVLAELVPADEWAPLRARTDDWIRIAGEMIDHVVMPDVETRLAAARRQLERADAATADVDRVNHLLLAISDLLETTPRFVALRLVEEAAEAVGLAEARAAGSPVPPSLRRARRLADWAARAVEEEDHVRAIQRAYYAIQLAEGG